MKTSIFFLIFTIFSLSFLYAEERLSSAPYLSGDTFRAHCDYIFDETHTHLKTNKLKYGSTIFVKTDLLSKFFKKIHPKIRYPYVLVTHNSDHSIPGKYGHMLENKKLLAWFGQNVENYSHPKLHPIPIGIANRRWPHGNIETFFQIKELMKDVPRQHLLYMNFAINTNSPVRSAVFEQFADKSYCLISSPKPFEEYLADVALAHFVLSPNGNGLDCHRTWEALYMGAKPIVSSSALDPLFEGLPVIIVQDWSVVTPEFLEQKFHEVGQLTMRTEKLWADYWFKQIDRFKM